MRLDEEPNPKQKVLGAARQIIIMPQPPQMFALLHSTDFSRQISPKHTIIKSYTASIVPEPCGYAVLLLITIIQKTVPCDWIENCMLQFICRPVAF